MSHPLRLLLLIVALLASLLLWMAPHSENEWTAALCMLFVLVFAVLPFAMLALNSPWRWRVMPTAALMLFTTFAALWYGGLLDDDYTDDNPRLALLLGAAGWCFSIVTGMLRSAAESRVRQD